MEHGAWSRTSDSHETHEGATAASVIRSERLDVNAMFEELFEVCDMRDCTKMARQTESVVLLSAAMLVFLFHNSNTFTVLFTTSSLRTLANRASRHTTRSRRSCDRLQKATATATATAMRSRASHGAEAVRRGVRCVI